MHASHPDCRCTELADGAAGKVLTCPDCGAIHVALPQAALRMDPPAFRDLVYLLARAQLALEGDGPSFVRSPASTVH